MLTGKLEVGTDVRIFAGAVIGEEPQDLKYRGEPSSLRIGARTCIREHVTIHRGCGAPALTHGNYPLPRPCYRPPIQGVKAIL